METLKKDLRLFEEDHYKSLIMRDYLEVKREYVDKELKALPIETLISFEKKLILRSFKKQGITTLAKINQLMKEELTRFSGIGEISAKADTNAMKN